MASHFPAARKSARLAPWPTTPTPARKQERARKFGAPEGDEGIVRCDACPVLCRIRPGRAGACDRYANVGGTLVRTDAIVFMQRAAEHGTPLVPFAGQAEDWDGRILSPDCQLSAPSSPASAPAPPIPTTSLRPSSCRASTRASTPSPW